MSKKTKLFTTINVMTTAAILATSFNVKDIQAQGKNQKSKQSQESSIKNSIKYAEYAPYKAPKNAMDLITMNQVKHPEYSKGGKYIEGASILDDENYAPNQNDLVIMDKYNEIDNVKNPLPIDARSHRSLHYYPTEKKITLELDNVYNLYGPEKTLGLGFNFPAVEGEKYKLNLSVTPIVASAPAEPYLKMFAYDTEENTDSPKVVKYDLQAGGANYNLEETLTGSENKTLRFGALIGHELKRQGSQSLSIDKGKSTLYLEGPTVHTVDHKLGIVSGKAAPNALVRIKKPDNVLGESIQTETDDEGNFTLMIPNFEYWSKPTVLQQEINPGKPNSITSLDTEMKIEDMGASLTEEVYELFTNQERNELKESTTQEKINSLKPRVDALLDLGSDIRALKAIFKTAQDLLTATTEVNSLQDDSGNLLPDKKQADLNAAKELVNALPQGPTKTQLTDKLEDLQEQLDKREGIDELKEEVNSLFTNTDYNELKEETEQSIIDALLNRVNALSDGEEKSKLLERLDLAQKLLSATLEVKKLADESGNILPTTTQSDIDAANKLVDALIDGPTKEKLLVQLDNLQDQLDQGENGEVSVKNINSMTELDSTISGTVSKNVERVYIYLNDQLIRWRPVDREKHSFIGHVSNTLKVGDVIKVIPQTAGGKQGAPKEVTVTKSEKLEAPIINNYFENDESISGTASEGTDYVRIYVNGEHLRKRNVEDGNKLTAYVLDAKPKKGDEIKVVPYDKNHHAGETTTVVVQQRQLQIDEYYKGDELLFGNTTKEADKVDIYVNDTFVRTRNIDKDTGDFYSSMRFNNALPKENDTIKVVARTTSGKILADASTTVKEYVSYSEPQVEEYKEGQSYIRGAVESGISKIRIYYGENQSEVLNRGSIDDKGTFSAYVLDLNLKTGDKFKVVGLDKDGRETPPNTVTVK